MMEELVAKGGKTLWFGPPPVINDSGEPCLARWEELFGVKYIAPEPQGRIAPGLRIDLTGQMENIPPQYILSDFIVDRIYPVEAGDGTSELARCDKTLLLGTGKGNAYYFGFRPRDDQSASLGYETRTLFEILDRVGAYPPTGTFNGVNDNPEHVSRTSDYLCTRFPNGTTVIVRHYKDHRENWGSGNSRNHEEDAKKLAVNPLDSDKISLDNFRVNGHEVTYEGTLTMAFRTKGDDLIAFDGMDCKQVTLDGNTFVFSDQPLEQISFAPSLDKEKELRILIKGEAAVNLPLMENITSKRIRLRGQDGKRVKHQVSGDGIQLNIDNNTNGHWLTLSWN